MSKITVRREDPSLPPPPPVYHITLDEETAKNLAALLGQFNGNEIGVCLYHPLRNALTAKDEYFFVSSDYNTRSIRAGDAIRDRGRRIQ